MSNRKYCVANWKMNMTIETAVSFVREFQQLPMHNKAELVICTDFVSLAKVADEIHNKYVQLGAQNVYFEKSGAYTGEISTDMLLKAGVKYVIIGHSERRHIFNESNKMLINKVQTVLSAGLIPIFCVGENLEDREQNLTNEVLTSQVNQGLDQIRFTDFQKIVIAYEPVWAIGTGLNADNSQIEEAHQIIRSALKSKGYSGDGTSILYGGSVNTKNADELLKVRGVDGFLIGGASLKVLDFFTIYQNFNKEMN